MRAIRKRQQYAPCIFCGGRDSPQHKEDVIPKWVARELAAIIGTDPSFIARTGQYLDPAWPTREYKAVGKLGWETKGPCQRCNNGWMSDLENKALPILLPLMKGKSRRVSAVDLGILAAWMVKTTVLHEYMHYASDRFFTRLDRYALRESHRIPTDTLIFAARYFGGPAATWAIGGPINIRFQESPTVVRAHTATLALGQLILQSFSFKRVENSDERLYARIPSRWDSVHKPVWPIALTGWSWPPALAVPNEAEFVRFAGRFTDTIHPPTGSPSM
jgi:hypothetical protein